LKAEFPEMSGFSRTNLFAMKKFYIFYSKLDPQFIPQPGGQLEFKKIPQFGGQSNNSEILE